MKVVIIEDEKKAAERLIRLLAKCAPAVEVLTVLPSVKGSIDWLNQHTAELLFCDIQLSDGTSFEIFDAVKMNTPIIFTTAYDEYAIKAFKQNSIDYLLKPVDEETLGAALDKFQKWRIHPPLPDYTALINELRSNDPFRRRLMVSYGQKLKSIPVEEAAYFFADEKLVFLQTFNDGKFVIDETMDELEQKMDPKLFIRANRKFIVHINSIKEMYHYSRSRVKLELWPANEPECIVSTEKSSGFKAWLNR